MADGFTSAGLDRLGAVVAGQVGDDQIPGLVVLVAPDPSVQPDPDTWIAELGSLPLLAQPGERWMYNTGASVLGVLLARAAGQPLADVLRTRVFQPLGMRDTGLWTTQTSRLATSYRPAPDGLAVFDEPDGMWSRPPAFGDAASGLVSTASDLLAFARMLLAHGSPVLPGQAARAMTTGQLTARQRARGGFGPDFFASQSWSYGQMVQDTGVFGWDGGLGTTWQVDPHYDLTVIILTQRMFESSDRRPRTRPSWPPPTTPSPGGHDQNGGAPGTKPGDQRKTSRCILPPELHRMVSSAK